MDIAVMPLAAVAVVTMAVAVVALREVATAAVEAAAQTTSGAYLPCCRKRVLILEQAA